LIHTKSIGRYKQNPTLSDYYIVLAKDLSVPERYTMKIAAKSVIWIWYAMLVKHTLLNALAPENFFSGLFCWVYLIWY